MATFLSSYWDVCSVHSCIPLPRTAYAMELSIDIRWMTECIIQPSCEWLTRWTTVYQVSLPSIVFLLVMLAVQNLLFWGFLQNLSGCSSEGWVDPWETISLWGLLVFSQHSYMLTLRSWTSLQCNWGSGARHTVWTAGSNFEIKCLNSMSHDTESNSLKCVL